MGQKQCSHQKEHAVFFFLSVTTTSFNTEATSYTLKTKICLLQWKLKHIMFSDVFMFLHCVLVLHKVLDKLQ